MIKVQERVLENRYQAYDLLNELEAPKHLVKHVKLVWEAGEILCDTFKDLNLDINYTFIEIGVAIHDVGKIIHTNEMKESGSLHEEEGEKLLLSKGVSREIAKVCVSHGQWQNMNCSLEEFIIALSDKLWKGKRVEKLEQLVIKTVAKRLNKDIWDVYSELDDCFELIANNGDGRLNRSVK